MAQNIMGSKMPTFPGKSKVSGSAKPPRPGQKFYRGSLVQQRADGKPPDGYGQNGWAGASSVMGTGRVASNLADMDTAPPGGDAVLSNLIDSGNADVSHQTRTVDATSRPVTYGMKAPAPGPKVPAKTGAVASAPVVRKP